MTFIVHAIFIPSLASQAPSTKFGGGGGGEGYTHVKVYTLSLLSLLSLSLSIVYESFYMYAKPNNSI